MTVTDQQGITRAFADHYANRAARARARAAQGTMVIGYVGADAPRELIAATGALPLRLHSRNDEPSDAALQLLGEATDRVVHSIMDQVLEGEFDFLAGILVSRDCEASLRLFYVLRELTEHRADIPPVHLVDILHLPRESTALYNRRQVAACARTLALWTGSKQEQTSLSASISQYEELRGRLQTLQSLRQTGHISGTTSLHVAAAAESLAPAHASRWIQELIQSVTSPDPTFDECLRLYFCGSAQDQDGVYRAIEDLGIWIVAEDHDWGLSSLPATVPIQTGASYEQLLGNIAQSYHYRSPAAATAPLEVHAKWSADQAKASSAAAVFCLTRAFDDAPAWDYPKMAEYLQVNGLTSVLLDRQPLASEPTVLQDALKALLETVSSGGH